MSRITWEVAQQAIDSLMRIDTFKEFTQKEVTQFAEYLIKCCIDVPAYLDEEIQQAERTAKLKVLSIAFIMNLAQMSVAAWEKGEVREMLSAAEEKFAVIAEAERAAARERKKQ